MFGWIQTSETGGQMYSDTSPSVPSVYLKPIGKIQIQLPRVINI